MYVARLLCFHYILCQMSTLFCTHAYFMYFVYLMWACSHDHALTPITQRWKFSTILKANLCILVDKDCIQHLNTSVSNWKTQFGSPLKTPKFVDSDWNFEPCSFLQELESYIFFSCKILQSKGALAMVTTKGVTSVLLLMAPGHTFKRHYLI